MQHLSSVRLISVRHIWKCKVLNVWIWTDRLDKSAGALKARQKGFWLLPILLLNNLPLRANTQLNWLFYVLKCVCVCVCERERERERDTVCCQCVVSFSHAFHAKGCPKNFSMKRNNSIKKLKNHVWRCFLSVLKVLLY